MTLARLASNKIPHYEVRMSILPPAGDLHLLHNRSYETRIYTDGTDMIARAALRDLLPPNSMIPDDPEPLTMHHMIIELRVAVPTLEIIEVNLDFEEFPNHDCPSIVQAYDQLIGLSIARGFTHKIRELFGGPRGCTHVVALLQAVAPAVVQATWGMARATGAEAAASDSESQLRNLNTCHIYAEDGEKIQMIRRGERTDPPLSVTRRLVELGRDPEDFYGS